MQKRVWLYSSIAVLIILGLLVYGISSRESAEQPAELPSPVVPVQAPVKDLEIAAENDSDLFPPLDVTLVAVNDGFQLQFNPEQYPHVNGTVTTSTRIVHGIARYDSEGSRLDALIVEPDQRLVKVLPMFEVELGYLNTSSLFTLIDDQHVMYVQNKLVDNQLKHDLVKINLETGAVTVIAPQIWVVDLDSYGQPDDFLLSNHYAPGDDPGTGKLLLTSFKGQVWKIDLADGSVKHEERRLYPAYGDLGSAPPRELVFPSPDLSSFVYQVGGGIAISNDFQVVDPDTGDTHAEWRVPHHLMSPGIVWLPDSEMFFLEYAVSEPVIGGSFDNAYYVFAQGIHFYHRDGTLMSVLKLPSSSAQRMNVYGWSDDDKVWIEFYDPQGSSDAIWTKGDVAYKLYDPHTERLVSYAVTEELDRLRSPVVVRSHTRFLYGSTPFLLVDMDNQLIWEPPLGVNAIYENDRLYIQMKSEEAGHIFSYNEQEQVWEWKLSEAGAYSGEHHYYTAPHAHHDRWLSYFRYQEKRIDYYDMAPAIARNGDGLPVLNGEFAKARMNGEWWQDQQIAGIEELDAGAKRREGVSRYGKLQLQSETAEQLLRYGSAYQYHGHYQVVYTDKQGRAMTIQTGIELALFQEEPIGSMSRYSYDGFDIVVLQPNHYRFSKSFDGGVKRILAYAVTEGGEAFPLDFRYASGSKLHTEPFITIHDHAAVEQREGRLIVQSMIGDGRFELSLEPNLNAQTLTVVDLRDRTVEYNQLQQIVSRYANRLEQALGLEDIALPEGRMEEEELRALFTDEAWHNPGFQFLRNSFAAHKAAGNPSRAFAWEPIGAKFIGPDTIQVTYTLNLWYAIGLAAHLDAEMKLVDGRWVFHELGTLVTEKLDGMPEYSDLLIVDK